MMTTHTTTAESDCDLCTHARLHGGWSALDGQSITHCADSRGAGVTGCGATWHSTKQAHCVCHHQQFASNGVAGLWHRDPDQCELRDEGYGPVWRTAAPMPVSAVRGVQGGDEPVPGVDSPVLALEPV